MTTTAQSIIRDAQVQLKDEAGVRWTATELVAALNDGQRALVALRPDMFTVMAPVALVAGARQAVPSDCAELIAAPRNTNGSVIRPVDRRLLDDVDPAWPSRSGVTVIKHVAREKFEPRHFYVYPPAAASGASLDLIYAAWPADVATPSGAAASTVSGNINADDRFKNALLHFCLFRAYSKDAEFGGDTGLAAAHYALFKSAAGVEAPAAARPRNPA